MTRARSGFPDVFVGWWIVAGAFVMYFVSGGLFSSATVFFKALTAEFGWGRGELAGVFSLGFLMAGVSAPVWGRIADRRGPRASFLPGVLLSGVLCMLLSRMSSLGIFCVLYVLFTFGVAGISLVPISVIISNWFVQKRGRAIGIAYTGVGFGGLVLTPVVGLLVARVGWRLTYVLSGLVVLIVLTPVVLLMKDRPEELELFPDGLARPPSNPGKPGSEAGQGASAPGFSLGDALRTQGFWMLALAWLVTMMPLTAITLHQVPFLTDLDLSTESAALAAGAVGGMSIIGRIGFGLLCERWPIRPMYACCYLMMGVGIASLWSTQSFGWLPLVPYVAFFGIAVGGAFAMSALLVGDLFGARALGEIFGLLGLAATIGGAAGGTGAGLIFDRTGGYEIVCALAVVLSVIGAVLMLCVKRPTR